MELDREMLKKFIDRSFFKNKYALLQELKKNKDRVDFLDKKLNAYIKSEAWYKNHTKNFETITKNLELDLKNLHGDLEKISEDFLSSKNVNLEYLKKIFDHILNQNIHHSPKPYNKDINNEYIYNIITDKPIAYESFDHTMPRGSKSDNFSSMKFIYKVVEWLGHKNLKVLDIGCAGGGFIKDLSDIGVQAVGVEGSDYSKRHKRAEWATIPDQLFTADATSEFQITVNDKNMKFNLITAWEFLEHIETEDLEMVFANIDKHLDTQGVCIMSVATFDDIVDGINYHRTVQPPEWWYKKIEQFGFKHHENMISYFSYDAWVRWEQNYGGSLHLVMTRKEEALPTFPKVKMTSKIKVAFFAIHPSIAEWESIYIALKKNKMFEPIVVPIPYFSWHGDEYSKNIINQMCDLYKSKNYNVFSTYDAKENVFISADSLKKILNLDVVFFPNGHNIANNYGLNYWSSECLTYIIPYSLEVSNLYQLQYNQHNKLAKKHFVPHQLHKEISKKHSYHKGSNVVVTGYTKCDLYLDKNSVPNKNIWKKQSIEKKKVIWAPHHTLPNNENHLNYSDFLINADIMFEIVQQYEDKIQFAFKPHLHLRQDLYNYQGWGEKRTDDYYDKWIYGSNTQLEESEYFDLFLTSDAMINSSGSFTAEYLCINKPCLFYLREDKTDFNSFGDLALSHWYIARSKECLYEFIEDKVLKGNDPIKKNREAFIREYLTPPNGKTATENICTNLIEDLNALGYKI